MNKKAPQNEKDISPTAVTIVRFIGLVISKVFWRIEFHDKENIPQNFEGGLLIVSNHQTYLDPMWISLPLRKFKLNFMAWDAAFNWILVGNLIRRLGAFPVSLKRGGTIKALKESLKILKQGETLMVFPEGSREFSDGKLLPFKTGAARLALQTKVPILPVTVQGANNVWSQDHKFPRFKKVKIFYHPIIETLDFESGKDLKEQIKVLNELLKDQISSKM